MKNVVKIACVGDVMCGDSFFSIGTGGGSQLDRCGEEFLSPEITDFLKQHDIVLCNLESILSDIGRDDNSLRSLHMRGRAAYAAYLSRWGINVANLANNHILEHGVEAAVDTARNLRRAGIQVVGAGANDRFESGHGAAVFPGSREIVILGACFHKGRYAFSGGYDKNLLLETIASLTEQRKTVLVSVHWGDDYMDRPSMEQKTIGAALIDAGAVAVIGHHPHVVQGFESSNGRLMAYSLGNFIFNTLQVDTLWSVILSFELEGDTITRWSCTPVVMDECFRPMFAVGDRKQSLEREIARRCELSAAGKDGRNYQERYHNDLKSITAQARKRLKRELSRRIWTYRPAFMVQLLSRPIKRRFGKW